MDQPMKKRRINNDAGRFWIAQHFKADETKMTSLDSIMTLFEEEKENLGFRLLPREVNGILREVFGESVSPSYRRDSSTSKLKRTVYYTGIAKKVSDVVTDELNPEFKEGNVYWGWLLRNVKNEILSFSKLSGIIINDNELAYHLVINKENLQFSLYGSCRKEIHLQVIPSVNVSQILKFISSLKHCPGIEDNQHNSAVVKNCTDVKCSSVVVNGTKCFMSHNCRQFVASNSKCDECHALQLLLKRRKEVYKNLIRVKNTLLSKEEQIAKAAEMAYDKKKTSQRLTYWRNKFDAECLTVDEEDHRDYLSMMDLIDEEKASPNMLLLLEQQQRALNAKTKNGHKWHPKIIRLCLDLYSTSPKAFDTIKQHLILPSKRLVRYYKNTIPHTSGWSEQVFLWCKNEAKALNLKEEDYWCGLIFDEMTIQEDLQFVTDGGIAKLSGAVSLGSSYDDARFLMTGNDEIELANKVMQFALVTDSGFRFALAHFPVRSLLPSTLLEKFWEGVEMCSRFGFSVYWLLCDGGEPNRSFVKMLFPNKCDPADHDFVAYNMHTGEDLVVMMDCKHNFKKIRNNIEKSSGKESGPRLLMNNNKSILFQHWKDCYNWDDKQHTLNIHERLTDSHFNLTPQSRMRNSLAEDLLDERMLFLMEKFKSHLVSEGKQIQAEELNESISLLRFTSAVISLFRRKDVISSMYDTRIMKAKDFIKYLADWKLSCTSPKQFFSDKLWFDLRAMIIGLEQVVRIKTAKFPEAVIKPVIINQDVVENIFCQVRAMNGQNSHPKYHTYGTSLTSVNIGQTVISKKGNTNGNSSALPNSGLPNAHPFRKKDDFC